MAELERAERNDEGRAREWLARALHAAPDPAWTADGHVSDRWLAASPVTGRLDAFEWRVPLIGMVSAPVIEPEPAPAAPAEIAATPPDEAGAAPPREVLPARRKGEEPQAKAGAQTRADHPAHPRARRSGPRGGGGERDARRRRQRRLAEDFRVSGAGCSARLLVIRG